jgi:hypothetical protein
MRLKLSSQTVIIITVTADVLPAAGKALTKSMFSFSITLLLFPTIAAKARLP